MMTISLIFLLLCVALLTLSTVLMCFALYKIKQTITDRMCGQIMMSRLITHSLAFIFYIASWVIFELFAAISSNLYYISWLSITIVGLTSEIFVFRLLWHLGTKNEQVIDFKACKKNEARESQPLSTEESDDLRAQEDDLKFSIKSNRKSKLQSVLTDNTNVSIQQIDELDVNIWTTLMVSKKEKNHFTLTESMRDAYKIIL